MKNVTVIKYLPMLSYIITIMLFFVGISEKYDVANFIVAMIVGLPILLIAYIARRYYLYLIKNNNTVIMACEKYSNSQKHKAIRDVKSLISMFISLCLWIKNHALIFIYFVLSSELLVLGIKETLVTVIAFISLYIFYLAYIVTKEYRSSNA